LVVVLKHFFGKHKDILEVQNLNKRNPVHIMIEVCLFFQEVYFVTHYCLFAVGNCKCTVSFLCAYNPNASLLVYISLFCVSRQFSFVLFNSSPLCPEAHSICPVAPCDSTELLISATRTHPWHSPRTALLLRFISRREKAPAPLLCFILATSRGSLSFSTNSCFLCKK
jgi:hypothetical protein